MNRSRRQQGRFATRGTGCAFSALVALLSMGVLASPAEVAAQGAETPNARHPGSAVVTFGQDEFLIRIECRVPSKPELGLTTEPNRITREEVGRSNGTALRLRPWEDTGDILVNAGGKMAWVPAPTSTGGVLSMQVELYPTTITRNGAPVLVTYDMWKAGEHSGEATVAQFEANCTTRDPEAPAYRKLTGSNTANMWARFSLGG